MEIGRYTVTGEIGRGGVGVVHRARTPEGCFVAIKVLRASRDATARARFERERRLLASFGVTEGFVPLLDGGETAEGPYLVMPFFSGGTLRDRLEKGALSVEKTAALARSLASALAIAHERGVVHRDLKPENVLFDGERPLIADLGLGKHFAAPPGHTSVKITLPGTFAGTAGYMPPEQMKSADTAGPEADVFALGAILWECLAGRPAFDGRTLAEVIVRLEVGCDPIEEVRLETPALLGFAIGRSLKKDPRARFPDGRALLRALDGEVVPPTGPISTDRKTVEHQPLPAPDEVPVVPPPVSSKARVPRARRRERRRTSLLVAALVLGGSSILLGATLAVVSKREWFEPRQTGPAAVTIDLESEVNGGLAVALAERTKGGHASYLLAVFRTWDGLPGVILEPGVFAVREGPFSITPVAIAPRLERSRGRTLGKIQVRRDGSHLELSLEEGSITLIRTNVEWPDGPIRPRALVSGKTIVGKITSNEN